MNSVNNQLKFDPNPIPRLSGDIVREIRSLLKAERAEEHAWEKEFGDVRQIVHADMSGRQFVAVGGRLFASDRWKTFTDFLLEYIKICLGGKWGENEIAKPFEDRHQIMKWYEALCHHQRKFERGSDGLIPIQQNGVTRSYLTLAYDLYILEHHQALQKRILRRLRQADQFQGARYELFVTAAMIRSGFEIEFEDETDSGRKHPEFVATHKRTGQKLCVEAKSKHRAGILGRPGTRVPDADLKVKIKGLLNDALQKPAKYPYVIFVDVNLPANTTNPELQFKEMERAVAEVWSPSRENPAPFAMVELTNFPYHYDEHRDVSALQVSSAIPAFYKPELSHPEVLQEIQTSVAKHGNIPKNFD